MKNKKNKKSLLFPYYYEYITHYILCSFIVWFLRSVIPADRLRFVETHIDVRLPAKKSLSAGDRDTILEDFTNDYLKIDGVFLLRLIAHNTNGITTTEVACAVFDQWKEYQDPRKDPTSRGIDESGESTELTERKDRSGSINM